MLDMLVSMHSPWVKVALPIVAILGVFMSIRLRKLDWRDVLGVRPDWKRGAPWFALYLAWMLGTDYFMDWRGPWDFSTWAQLPATVIAMRVAAVVVLGPIAEELIFRGLIYWRIARTRLHASGAVVVCAALWALLHYFYGLDVIAVIFAAGLLLGAARVRSGSVIVPVLMHICWNLYAIW